MKKHNFTYEKSGVNVNAADNFVKFISNISSKNKGNKKFKNIGGLAQFQIFQKILKDQKLLLALMVWVRKLK